MGGQDLVIIGVGGFGRETVDVVEAINSACEAGPRWRLLGACDDDPSELNLERMASMGVRYLGPVADAGLSAGVHFIVGIGDPRIRRVVAEACEAEGWLPAVLVHPRTVVGSVSDLAPGTVICSGVVVSTNVRTGRHVHINPNATIGHDVNLDDYVSVNPAAIVSGEVSVRSEALIGAGSVILRGLCVGLGATVGAAACVVSDVSSGVVVKGVPAR